MNKMPIDKRQHGSLSVAIFAIVTCLPLPASPGAPEGHPLSIERGLHSELTFAMDRYAQGSASLFEKEVKAFVWDHRQHIDIRGISDSRLIDAAVCILKEGYSYPGFEGYAGRSSFMEWCSSIHQPVY
jgi:hypothetical protein